jgi:D-alanyl-D-alanine-carboxypeptidase/D-alanyl-D-alanine-endopeptidase
LGNQNICNKQEQTMKKYLAVLFLLATTNTVLGQIPTDSIKAIIKREVANKRIRSIIVGIVDSSGRRIVSEGTISDKNPMLPDASTIYEIGSITKVFTSLLLADMSLKHELDLDDPVSKFLPNTINAPTRNGKEISLRNLSTHRSALPRNAWNIDPKNLDNPFADYTTKQLFEFIPNATLIRDIDSKWQYSNIAYSLLGHILATVGHKNFESLIDERICKPLNMNNTFLALPPKRELTVAPGHNECGKPTSDWDFPLAGGGGLRSNVNDMLTFAAANLGFVKTDILPAMELSHIKQAKKDGNDGYVSLGWTLWSEDGKNILFKDGGTGGYRSFLGIDKKNKFGVVILANSNNIITDIGLHILDSTAKVNPYRYPWNLLDTIRATVKTNGVTAGIELYQSLKGSNTAAFIFNEYQLNYLGHELRKDKKIKEAIKIFELNATEYPKSAMVYESLGELYKRNGNTKTAIPYFEKLVAMEPENQHWSYMLDKLRRQ